MITDEQEKQILYSINSGIPLGVIEVATKIPQAHIRLIQKYHQLKGTLDGEKENTENK